jgi:hypothetical protein
MPHRARRDLFADTSDDRKRDLIMLAALSLPKKQFDELCEELVNPIPYGYDDDEFQMELERMEPAPPRKPARKQPAAARGRRAARAK